MNGAPVRLWFHDRNGSSHWLDARCPDASLYAYQDSGLVKPEFPIRLRPYPRRYHARAYGLPHTMLPGFDPNLFSSGLRIHGLGERGYTGGFLSIGRDSLK